jgi:hypothetical protein
MVHQKNLNEMRIDIENYPPKGGVNKNIKKIKL